MGDRRPRRRAVRDERRQLFHRSFEELESRRFLSAATDDYPVIDMNGPAPGNNAAATLVPFGPAVPLGDSAAITILSAAGELQSVRIGGQDGIDLGTGYSISADTSGTNIQATLIGGEYVLSGVDTVENYEAVLRSVRIASQFENGQSPLYLSAVDVSGTRGPRSHTLITYMPRLPPRVDLNGGAPGDDYFTSFTSGGPAVPIVDAAGLAINASGSPVVFGARLVPIGAAPGTLTVDTQGTNIVAFQQGGFLELSVPDLRENYEKVLRTAKFETTAPATDQLVAIQFSVRTQLEFGPPSISYVSVGAPDPPILVDLNGPEEGRNLLVSVLRGALQQPIFDDALTIEAPPQTQLSEAFIALQGASGGTYFSATTTGTNINFSPTLGGVVLWGLDSVENYEQVLRSVLLNYAIAIPPNSALQLRVTVTGPAGESMPAIAFVNTISPFPLPSFDLDGDPAREFYTTSYRIGDPPVPVVDPAGLTIHVSGAQFLFGVDIHAESAWPGRFAVDTSGTAIVSQTDQLGMLTLTGNDTVANYQQVLRTLTYQAFLPETEATRIVFSPREHPVYQGLISETLVRIESTPASVVGRHIFYNNSKLDGYDPGANAADDAAIASDKTPYFAGAGLASHDSVTSYHHGINGIMIDVVGLAGPGTADDFTFKMGTSNDPEAWTFAPEPSQVLLRLGAGEGGSNRVVIVWPSGAIKNTWLQVTLEGNDEAGEFNTNTGLAASDVFYFGNRVGDTFAANPAETLVTSANDEIDVRSHYGFGAAMSNPYDFNRDGLVNANDTIIARGNMGFTPILNLAPPPSPLVSEGSGDAGAVMPRGRAAVASAIAVSPPASSEDVRVAWAGRATRVGYVRQRSVEAPVDLQLSWKAIEAVLTEQQGAQRDNGELLSDLLGEI